MTFTDAIKVVLTMKYATFTGRAGRAEYWWFALFQTLVLGGLILPMLPVFEKGSSDQAYQTAVVFAWLLIAAALALVIPWMAVSVRRLHDIGQAGQSGALLLLGLIPFGNIALMIIMAQPTGPDNRYGQGDNRHPLPSARPSTLAADSPALRNYALPHRKAWPAAVPAAWLTDPDDPTQLRFWNGAAWTESRYRPEL